MNLFSVVSSLLDLRILISGRQGKMHFDTYFWLYISYIYHIYISYIHSYQNSPIIMTNGIKKVRKGVDIFNKRIFDSCKLYLGQCFRIQPCLSQLSFPRSQHIINWYHSAWCTTYQDSTLDVSIFLVSGKREREERERETTIFFFFS